jgi:Na+/proline symporter
LLQLLLCFWISKKIKNEDDYLVGGRSSGYFLISLSLFATWFGAETCIGSSAEVYKYGLSGSRADPFGYSLCLFLTGLLIAPKIWSKKYVTLADYYKDRFGGSTESLAVFILAFSALIWSAAQLRAFGQVLSTVTDWPIQTALFISFAFVLLYVLFGGLMGDIITDAIQSVVIVIGLFLIFYFVFKQTDQSLFNLIKNQPSDRLSILGERESILSRVDRWMIPVLGSLVAQEIISRIFASRSKSVAVRSSYLAGLVYIFIGLIPVSLGLVGPSLIFVTQGNEEQFILKLAEASLPLFFAPVFFGAIVSALLATIDSILLSSSALISHNLVIPKFKIKKEKQKVFISRLVVFLCGVLSYLLAIYSNSIYSLLEIASSFGTAGVLVITILGLWFSFGNALTSTLTLVAGLVLTPFFEYYLKSEAPFVFSILFCLIIYLAHSVYLHVKVRSGQSNQAA